MKTLADLVAGDPVVMRDVNRKGPRHTKVVKVTKQSIHIECDTTPYDRETGRCKDKWGHQTITTVEQDDLNVREEAARTALRDIGVNVEPFYRTKLKPEQIIALAEYAKQLLGQS